MSDPVVYLVSEGRQYEEAWMSGVYLVKEDAVTHLKELAVKAYIERLVAARWDEEDENISYEDREKSAAQSATLEGLNLSLPETYSSPDFFYAEGHVVGRMNSKPEDIPVPQPGEITQEEFDTAIAMYLRIVLT